MDSLIAMELQNKAMQHSKECKQIMLTHAVNPSMSLHAVWMTVIEASVKYKFTKFRVVA